MYALQALQFCIARDSAVLVQQEQFTFDIGHTAFLFSDTSMRTFFIRHSFRQPSPAKKSASQITGCACAKEMC